MFSVLAWLGAVALLVGIISSSISPGWLDYRWWDGIVIGGGLLILVIVQFAYCHRVRCREIAIPKGSVALVVAFLPEDRDANKPGQANERLAESLAKHAESFSLILAQEAIIWALRKDAKKYGYEFQDNPPAEDTPDGKLKNTPVYRMHKHNNIKVRTLETLCCALNRLGDTLNTTIVLFAHDKHYDRAYRDLRSIFKGNIISPCIPSVPYSTSFFLKPMSWATREVLWARPMEFFERHFCTCCCREEVRYDRISNP